MPDEKPKKNKHIRWGAALGAVLAVACHLLPPKFHHACDIVSQFAGLTCGNPRP